MPFIRIRVANRDPIIEWQTRLFDRRQHVDHVQSLLVHDQAGAERRLHVTGQADRSRDLGVRGGLFGNLLGFTHLIDQAIQIRRLLRVLNVAQQPFELLHQSHDLVIASFHLIEHLGAIRSGGSCDGSLLFVHTVLGRRLLGIGQGRIQLAQQGLTSHLRRVSRVLDARDHLLQTSDHTLRVRLHAFASQLDFVADEGIESTDIGLLHLIGHADQVRPRLILSVLGRTRTRLRGVAFAEGIEAVLELGRTSIAGGPFNRSRHQRPRDVLVTPFRRIIGHHQHGPSRRIQQQSDLTQTRRTDRRQPLTLIFPRLVHQVAQKRVLILAGFGRHRPLLGHTLAVDFACHRQFKWLAGAERPQHNRVTIGSHWRQLPRIGLRQNPTGVGRCGPEHIASHRADQSRCGRIRRTTGVRIHKNITARLIRQHRQQLDVALRANRETRDGDLLLTQARNQLLEPLRAEQRGSADAVANVDHVPRLRLLQTLELLSHPSENSLHVGRTQRRTTLQFRHRLLHLGRIGSVKIASAEGYRVQVHSHHLHTVLVTQSVGDRASHGDRVTLERTGLAGGRVHQNQNAALLILSFCQRRQQTQGKASLPVGRRESDHARILTHSLCFVKHRGHHGLNWRPWGSRQSLASPAAGCHTTANRDTPSQGQFQVCKATIHHSMLRIPGPHHAATVPRPRTKKAREGNATIHVDAGTPLCPASHPVSLFRATVFHHTKPSNSRCFTTIRFVRPVHPVRIARTEPPPNSLPVAQTA